MIRVRGHAEAGQFSIDFRAPAAGVLERLKNNHPGPLA